MVRINASSTWLWDADWRLGPDPSGTEQSKVVQRGLASTYHDGCDCGSGRRPAPQCLLAAWLPMLGAARSDLDSPCCLICVADAQQSINKKVAPRYCQ